MYLLRAAHSKRDGRRLSKQLKGGGVFIPRVSLKFEWLPTAKRPQGAEAVIAYISGRSTPFGAKKRGSQLQTKNIMGALGL